jgi:AAA domain
MPILKASDPLPAREPIVLIYGEPGTGKTSVGNTCRKPLVLDFDKGASRAALRQDALIVDDWDEVIQLEKEGVFNAYETIVIDTAKAALDDFLMSWVAKQDPALRSPKNKLRMYGAIADAFKLFINARRQQKCGILIVAHAKKDEDSKKVIPDVTGGSYQLLLRIADQVGYVSVRGGRRTIQFEPTDETVGKNVARLRDVAIPGLESPDFAQFGASLMDSVKSALVTMSEEQREAENKSEIFRSMMEQCANAEVGMLASSILELPQYLRLPLMANLSDNLRGRMLSCNTVDKFNDIFGAVNELPDEWKNPLRHAFAVEAKKRAYIANPATKRFELPPAAKVDVDELFAPPTPPGEGATFEDHQRYRAAKAKYDEQSKKVLA